MKQMWEIIQCLITACVIISEESRYIFVDAEAKVILEDDCGVSMERFCLCLLSPLFSVMGRWYVNKHMHATVWSPADDCDKTGCILLLWAAKQIWRILFKKSNLSVEASASDLGSRCH